MQNRNRNQCCSLPAPLTEAHTPKFLDVHALVVTKGSLDALSFCIMTEQLFAIHRSLLKASLLVLNAGTILHRDRFLRGVGLAEVDNSTNPNAIKNQCVGLLQAISYMKGARCRALI